MSTAFPLESIPEADISPALDQAIRRMLCECFPADAEAFSRARCWHESSPAYTVVCRERDRVLGHVAIVERQIACGPTPLLVAGVQSLAVVPAARRTGLSGQLMNRAMDEARRRGIPWGLLFCVPDLSAFYGRLGWRKIDRPVTMQDEHGRPTALPAKNIAMVLDLSSARLPDGPLDLCGRDW